MVAAATTATWPHSNQRRPAASGAIAASRQPRATTVRPQQVARRWPRVRAPPRPRCDCRRED
eukprot:3623316-Alexandrium_andersonii.AAC.1